MSRIAKEPVVLPSGIDVRLEGQNINVKGKMGELSLRMHDSVAVEQTDGKLVCSPKQQDDKKVIALVGTTRALLSNMVVGVSTGFSKKLQLVGVGYRAQLQGNKLVLSLGFSHPVEVDVPGGLKVEVPSQTEVVVSGSDKQQVGQFASEIRAFRPPEPYKGKGVRYADERVVRREAKKT